MENIFSRIYQSQEASKHAQDLSQRAFMPILGVVVDNKDPENRRRIKVSDPAAPGLSSDWIRRLQAHPGIDPPLPPLGSTVVVLSIDGSVVNQFYLQCVNDTNPPLKKPSPTDDLHQTVAGEQDERTGQNRVIDVGASLTLRNDAGASITLKDDGDVVITDGSGNKLTLADGISFNTASLTVGGKQITTIDASDDRGHKLVSKGW